MTSVKTRLPSRKVLPYSDQLIYEANVVNCNCFYSSIKPTQIDNIWYAHFWTTPHRAKNKRFLTLRCTKTGSTQPKLSAACFVVQSCLADADFVVFSNYCLIGTRQTGCFSCKIEIRTLACNNAEPISKILRIFSLWRSPNICNKKNSLSCKHVSCSFFADAWLCVVTCSSFSRWMERKA